MKKALWLGGRLITVMVLASAFHGSTAGAHGASITTESSAEARVDLRNPSIDLNDPAQVTNFIVKTDGPAPTDVSAEARVSAVIAPAGTVVQVGDQAAN